MIKEIYDKVAQEKGYRHWSHLVDCYYNFLLDEKKMDEYMMEVCIYYAQTPDSTEVIKYEKEDSEVTALPSQKEIFDEAETRYVNTLNPYLEKEKSAFRWGASYVKDYINRSKINH